MKKRILCMLLAAVMVLGMLPTTAFAAHDATNGKPLNLADNVVLSVYTGDNFPGESNTHMDTSGYVSFDSSFNRGSSGYSNSATGVLDQSILTSVTQGTTLTYWGNEYYVWGVFDTSAGAGSDSLAQYFLNGANNAVFSAENQAKMIASVKGISTTEAANYEVVWYVIKFQTSDTAWHIDGIIREKTSYSVNYYGNGNTAGGAPMGSNNLAVDTEYTILGNTGSGNDGNLTKVENGITYKFAGWNTKPDGTGTAYAPGQKVVLNDTTTTNRALSLYAQWTDKIYYNATVNTYLNGVLTDIDDIHEEGTKLFLKEQSATDYIALTHGGTGTYTAALLSGTYYPHHLDAGASDYHQISNHQLIIQNANGSLAIHHYSVDYNTNGGAFATGENPGTVIYASGSVASVTDAIPVRDGYIFTGWTYNGNTYTPAAKLTDSITSAITLTAQWEKAVDVTINVTINHQSGSSYDQTATKDELLVSLLEKLHNGELYLETGDKLNFTKEGVTDGNGNPMPFQYTPTNNAGNEALVTKYLATAATYEGMLDSSLFDVRVSKHGYDVTSVTKTKDANGDWTIDIVLDHSPDSFDLQFSAEMESSIPKELYPDAVIVKIVHWNAETQEWEVIIEQAGNKPGIRIDIDPATGKGNGSYPVWKHESGSGTPYGYRFIITGFVYDADTVIVPGVTINGTLVTYTDGNYTATMGEVTDGKLFGDGLNGAYYDDAAQKQTGTLNALLTLEKYDVILDAQGGDLNATPIIKDQYYIPELDSYVPTMTGHTFGGWYLDQECTKPVIEGALLAADITVYAKWDQTITGSLTLAGKYIVDGQEVVLWDSTRATNATVVLQEITPEGSYNVASQTVTITWGADEGISTQYSFTGLDANKTYRIEVLLNNYESTYQNSTTPAGKYNANDYTAVFPATSKWETFVNAYLNYEPVVYEQKVEVDASKIGAGFRPDGVLAEVLFKHAGTDDSTYLVITQHSVDPWGLQILLDANGFGTDSEAVWTESWDGTVFIYQLKVTKIDGQDTASLPVSVTYGPASYYSPANGAPTGVLKATLAPNKYDIIYDWNVDGVNDEVITDGHTWSFATSITYVPTRTGYNFGGWYSDEACTAGNEVTSIGADVQADTTLYAKWTAKTDLELTVNHVNQQTGATIETEVKTGQTFGAVITAESLKKTFTGYTYHSASAASVTIAVGENEITLYYTKDSYNYTVNYLEQGTDTVLATQKNGSGQFGASITEAAVAIPGYNVVGNASQTFTIDADNKVVNFYYAKRTDLTLTVSYVEQGTTTKLLTDKTVTGLTFGAEIDVDELVESIPGFAYVESDPAALTVAASGNAVTLYYKRIDVGYTVEYYFNGVKADNRTVRGFAPFGTTVNRTFDFEVSYDSKTYIYDHAENNPMTIKVDAASNVMKVFYLADADGDDVPDAYQATVTYFIVNGTWDGTKKDPISAKFDMKKFENGAWVELNPTLGSTIPTGMVGNTGYTENPGHWDETITADTKVVDGNEYTFAFLKLDEHVITATVTNGTVTVNGTLAGGHYSNVVTDSNTAETTMVFAAISGYTLEYASVDGRHYTAQEIMTWGHQSASITLDHKGDHAVIAHYALDENGDDIPDKYQKKVTFVVKNGTWADGKTESIVKYITLFDALGEWSEYGSGELLLTDIPTGMKAATGYDVATGAWDTAKIQNATANVTLTGTLPETYTFDFAKLKITITIEVVNGSSFPASSTAVFDYDASHQTTAHFWPNAGYIFESVTVNGTTNSANTVTGKGTHNGVETDTYTYAHDGNLTIRVVYVADQNGDNIPDKYQKKVTFKVVNGKWSDGTDADKVVYLTLMKAGEWAEDGTASLTAPAGMTPNTDYKGGAWDVTPPAEVSGTNEETYTYSYVKTGFADYTYKVEHYIQLPDGSYLRAETETKTVSIELNVAGNGFEAGKIPTVNAVAKIFDSHHTENQTHPRRIASGTPVYGEELTLKLYYDLGQHTVKYELNGGHPVNGTTYDDEKFLCGNTEFVKPAPNYTGHTFTGWLGDDGKLYSVGQAIVVDKDITLTAQWDIDRFTVTYTDGVENETVFADQSTTVNYGADTPAFVGTPTRTGYTFKGWSPAVADKVTRTVTYTAQWEQNIYTVVFKNEDGTVISTDTYSYGETIRIPADPTKAADGTNTYTFAGWSPTVSVRCIGNATYTATYTSALNSYTVVFKNADGTILSAKTYNYGDTIEIPADPTKRADIVATYAFAGWTPTVETICKGNATYTATYISILNSYTVIFKDEDGTIISINDYNYSDTVKIPADPTKAADAFGTYTFAGWTPAVETICRGNATYTATYAAVKNQYTVVFKDEDGTVISTNTYGYGDTVAVPADPTKAADGTNTYTFAGWTPAVETTCKGDAEYVATYTATKAQYTVVFKDEDGTVISTNTYGYGDTVAVPADPTKAADGTNTYTFAGWTPAVETTCKGDAEYVATYTATKAQYTVVFKDEDGTVISSKTYSYGDTVEVPADPTKAANQAYTYTFAGWTPAVETTCKGDATYTATYTATQIPSESPDTGDNSHTELFIALLIVSLAGVVSVLVHENKRKYTAKYLKK